MPFAYGGGIKNIEEIERLFYLGVEKVIINSSLKNKDLIKDTAENAWEKTKDVANDIWEKTKDVAENVKDKTEDMIDDVKDEYRDRTH
jgi:cyclase